MAEYGKDQIKVMREQAMAIGMNIDERWKPETLAIKLEEAQEEVQTKRSQDFRAAQKMPVELVRNAFTLDDVKHQKGEVIDVPIDLAKKWIVAGIANRADPLPGE